MNGNILGPFLGLVTNGAVQAEKHRYIYLDTANNMIFTIFMIAGVGAMTLSAIALNNTDFTKESSKFKGGFIGGYVALFLGGLCLTISKMRWMAYGSPENRKNGDLNNVPYFTSFGAAVLVFSGICLVFASTTMWRGEKAKVENKDEKEETSA